MWNSQSQHRKKRNNFNIELLNHNVNMIMQSQLLLDEDQQIIATYWSPLAMEVPRNHLKWMNSAISLSGTTIGIKFKNWQLVVASCIPMAIKTVYDCYNSLRLRKHKRIFKKLIFLLKEQYNLNRLICEHFQKRTNALAALSDQLKSSFILTLIRKQEKEFADLAVNNILQICLEIQKNLLDISTNLGLEEKTYCFMCNWDLEAFLGSSAERERSWGQTSILKTFDHFSQYYDTYRLLMSSFLGCVALSMSINIWRDADKFNSILYNNIPNMSIVIQRYISQTRDSFENLRYTLMEQPVPKLTYFASNDNHSIFIKPLSDCIRNIQLTYDITRSLHKKIIHNKEPNSNDMKTILEDLLEHNRSTLESIKIAVKMNNVVAENKKMPLLELHSSDPRNLEDSVEVIMSIQDDPSDNVAQDEEYSLSPWESDEKEDEAIDRSSLHFEDLITCVNSQKMLIKELREKLRLIREKKLIREEYLKKENVEAALPGDFDNVPSTSRSIPQLGRSGDKTGTSQKNNLRRWGSESRITISRPQQMVDFLNSMPELTGPYDCPRVRDYQNTAKSMSCPEASSESLKEETQKSSNEETYGSSENLKEDDSLEEIVWEEGMEDLPFF